MGLLFRLLQMTTPVKQAFQILAVDDESTVLRGIKMLLEHDGHKVHAVDSGEAAMVLFEQRRFDLVITDFSMPGMKGDQLAARIKAIRPDQPIIMATAFADEFKTFGRPSGGVDFLLFKPFSIADLREAATNRCWNAAGPSSRSKFDGCWQPGWMVHGSGCSKQNSCD